MRVSGIAACRGNASLGLQKKALREDVLSGYCTEDQDFIDERLRPLAISCEIVRGGLWRKAMGRSSSAFVVVDPALGPVGRAAVRREIMAYERMRALRVELGLFRACLSRTCADRIQIMAQAVKKARAAYLRAARVVAVMGAKRRLAFAYDFL